MAFDPISAAFELGSTAIKRIWPDPIDQARELNKLTEIKQRGDLAELQSFTDILLGQIKVNEVSASHPSLFVAGARPAAIWAGVAAMVWSGIIHPLLLWVWAFAEMTGTPPPLIESASLMTIMTGLLGIAGMRSHDKKHKVSKDSLS